MTNIELPPAQLRFMNEDDEKFLEIGRLNLDLLTRHGFSDRTSLLDIGSGYGRLAYAIHSLFPQYLGPYMGFDILKRHVDWCVEAFANEAQFQFRYQNLRNARYNPEGAVETRDYRFDVSDQSIDMAVLFSVFTHMYESDIQNYVQEIARVLVAGGVCICTFFLFDDLRLKKINDRTTGFRLPYEINEYTRYSSEEDPLHVISYKRSYVEELFRRNGFTIIDISNGNWVGGTSPHFQDQVVVRRG